LQAIHAFIADDNLDAAARLIDKFFDHFQMLAAQPQLGTLREDLHPELRLWTTGRYVILYMPSDVGIDIAHVVHGARDIESLIARRET